MLLLKMGPKVPSRARRALPALPSLILKGSSWVCLSVCLCVCLTVFQPVFLSFYLSIGLSVCVSVCVSVCLSVCEQDNSRNIAPICTKFGGMV